MRWLAIAACVFVVSLGSARAQPPPPYAPVPPPRYEAVPPPPPGPMVWEPGHWHWNGATYVWVPGHYVHRHPHYRTWVEGRWVWAPGQGRWIWQPAHWQ
ncbi:MAG: YXWGXW repeat-containing protein [Rhodospirillales bacterium]|nr:YXWGXW repeat-containing protein [Rhodospirillales bacterium]MBN8898939.1 YXWGXW repeat-containing protein [Rhodospirillales bacterium]